MCLLSLMTALLYIIYFFLATNSRTSLPIELDFTTDQNRDHPPKVINDLCFCEN